MLTELEENDKKTEGKQEVRVQDFRKKLQLLRRESIKLGGAVQKEQDSS